MSVEKHAHFLEEFDPLEGESPEVYKSEFEEVLRRARKRVKQYDKSDIRQAVAELEREMCRVRMDNYQKFIKEQNVETKLEPIFYESDLHNVFTRHYLPCADSDLRLSPHEYCAALAIAIVASVIPNPGLRQLNKEILHKSDEELHRDYNDFAYGQLERAFRVMEISDIYVDFNQRQSGFAKKTHKAKTELQHKFNEFYKDKPETSLRTVATWFYQGLSDDEKKDLSEDEDTRYQMFRRGWKRYQQNDN